MAEARSAVREPRVYDLEEGREAWRDFIRAWRKAILRRFFRTRNLIYNGMWPTSIWNLCAAVTVFSTLLVGDWSFAEPVNTKLWYLGDTLRIHKGLPYMLRVFIVSFLGGIVFFIILMYKRRWLLRVLLSYRGWMYEPPRIQSAKTKIWAWVVRLASGYHPTTYSYQKSLPFLPVPSLDHTLEYFLKSIKPIYSDNPQEYENFKKGAQEFQAGLGPKLQRILVLKSWWAQNWVTDWWEKYVYLMSRSPIAINSNYYVLDQCYWKPTHRQISRAASTIYQYMVVKRQIDREQWSPLLIRNTIPLCMSQYERPFSTTRIPGEDIDELVKCSSTVSKHLVVMRKGIYYQLDVFDKDDMPLTPQSLEKQLQWIVDDADNHQDEYCESMRSVSALTGLERTEWARIRKEHFTSGMNRETLDVLERALFHVILDIRSFSSMSERAKHLLHGDGKTLWFDKSFQLLFFSNGQSGINAEHSWGDAPVMGHISEFNLTKEIVDGLYDSDGYCLPISNVKQGALRQPTRLLWEMPAELAVKIDKAVVFNQKNNEDLDLCICDHTTYGKGFIKTCKVSPDAYIQLALHFAYYKDAGKFVLTYESSMTRLYLLGRTETVRSLTMESADFINAMMDKSRLNEERIELLRKACDVHQRLYRDAMCGKAIDRHLFGLFVTCKGLGYESEFLRNALMIPWTLSTSQQPQQQIVTSPDCTLKIYQDKVSPGGGFGPVSDTGYGVSYMLPGDDRIFFHVSSKKSAKVTNSEKFVKLLYESLDEMRQLFLEPKCGDGGTSFT